MASEEHAPGFMPGLGFTQEDWDEVCDTPELTEEQFARSRPFIETHPEVVAAIARRRGLQRAPTKAHLSLRLDRDVIDVWRASGPGWQARMGEVLRKAAGL